MNSLEFIENEIKQLEKRKEQAFKNEYYSVYKECSQKITILQQIKSELEAWYSIKQGIKLCEGKVYEDSYYEYLQFEEELFDESESEDAGERLTPIKKALEVKNES